MIYKKLFELKKREIKLKRDSKAYNYKYAKLDQIQKKIWPTLDELNLLVYHQVEDNYVITTIMDLDDESKIESKINLSWSTKAQDKGSEITYFRRYNLLSLLDLEVEDDDWKAWSKDVPKKCKQCWKECKPWKEFCSEECFKANGLTTKK